MKALRNLVKLLRYSWLIIYGSSYYDSIHTVPARLWFECSRTNSLKPLLIRGFYRERDGLKAFRAIRKELIENFGLEPAYKDYLQAVKGAAWDFESFARGDKTAGILARMKMAEAQMLLQGGEGVDYSQAVASMSRAVGYQLPRDITLAEWIGYSKALRA